MIMIKSIDDDLHSRVLMIMINNIDDACDVNKTGFDMINSNDNVE